MPDSNRPRALTVKQPWADAIAHGAKRTENRTWPLPKQYVGARILLHAGAAYDPMGRFIITDRAALDSWPDTRRAIIAAVTLTGCHLAHHDDNGSPCCPVWGEPEVYHWTLDDVTPLPEPVPCKGQLGLWRPTPAAADAAFAQVPADRRDR